MTAEQHRRADGATEAEARAGLKIPSLRSHTARGTLVNTAFLIALSGLALAKGFVGASYLDPSQFGIWGLLSLALLSVLWLRDVGVNDKYIQQSEADQENEFLQAFTLSVVFMLACTLAMDLMIVAFVVAYDLPELLAPGLVLSTVLLAGGLQFPAWAFYRRMDYAGQRLTQSVEPLLGFLCSVTLLIAGFDYWALVIGATVGAWAGAAVAIKVSPYPVGFELGKGTAGRYLQFAWPLIISTGVGVVLVQVTYFVGEAKLGLAGVGALTLVGTLSTFTNKADSVLTQTLYPAICAIRNDTSLLLESFVKSNRLALMWGFPFGVGLALFAEDLVRFVLGDQWLPAVTYLQLIALTAAFNHVGFNWTAYFRARGDTRPIAATGVIALILFLLVPIPLLATLGLNAFGVGMLAYCLINLVIRAYFIRRLFSTFAITAQLLRAAVPALVPLALVLAERSLLSGPDTAPQAAGEFVVFIVGCVVATYLLERDLLREALGYLGRAGTASAPKPLSTETIEAAPVNS